MRGTRLLAAALLVWAPGCADLDAPPVADEVLGLASPPDDAQGFVEFGDAALRSQRIASLLGP